MMRTGDTVYHRPTGERWLVAAVWPEDDRLAWCGWPEGRARMSDCDLVKVCDDAAHWALVEQIAASRADDARVRHCRYLLAQRSEGVSE